MLYPTLFRSVSPHLVWAALITMACQLFVGCVGDGTNDTTDSVRLEPQTTGSLRLFLKDKPLDGIEEVNITLASVHVHSVVDGWLAFSESPQSFDLLKLRDISTELGLQSLPSGRYNQIRLLISDSSLKINGKYETLSCPSCTQSGLKIAHAFTIDPHKITEITIDFDASRSVHQAGQSDQYILKPVLNVVVSERDAAQALIDSGLIKVTYISSEVTSFDAPIPQLMNRQPIAGTTDRFNQSFGLAARSNLQSITDQDGDGVPASIDCDDTNPLISPFAPEIRCDGLSQNCTGFDYCDQDADGYISVIDCDDLDANMTDECYQNSDIPQP